MRKTVEIRVSGTVQGVGFRPMVWRLARSEGLTGEVLNNSAGVLIRTTGTEESISNFIKRLRAEAPPLSRIEAIQTESLPGLIDFTDFRIAESTAAQNRTRVTPDAAICPACQAEVFNPAERRFQYPFANCTHCGPRFSIVNSVPFDRPRTTMADFPMCTDCDREYHDPADRRFHAQAIACPVCGPHVWLETGAGLVAAKAEAMAEAVARLKLGEVLALRGLGGFHLACDATNPAAVERLRQRKRRYGKPFALMARSVELIRRYCTVTAEEQRVLESPEAPIVLLPINGATGLPAALAPGLNTLGFMLPYTPLHALLLEGMEAPLVMTSGNLTDEPQVTDLANARLKLHGIADAVLSHNREIANRIDDSVVRFMAGELRIMRRARGYAPSAIPLPAGFENAPDLLAFGGELKSTFCLVKDGAAILSQHQGDLEDLSTFEDYQKNLRLYTELYDHAPSYLVADLHPEYLSSKLARERARHDGVPLLEIQHHHAHIASCLVENGVALDAPPVLGIALDGLGFGDDGTFWGGEFLLADYQRYERLGTFKPVAMPGGAQAIREPWRNTYAHLVAASGWEVFQERFGELAFVQYLSKKPLPTIDRMLLKGVNVPLASSCGRLFDAVSAAVGFCPDKALFEGQGAMELEAVITNLETEHSAYPFTVEHQLGKSVPYLDPAQMWTALSEDLHRGIAVAEIAARFHRGLADGIAEMARVISKRQNNGARLVEMVALSGGCFQNRILLEAVVHRIESQGMKCLLHARVPANDGGLALGQAAIGAARLLAGPSERI